MTNPPDEMHYYSVQKNVENNRYYLQDYNGGNLWYVSEVYALAKAPDPTPNHRPS